VRTVCEKREVSLEGIVLAAVREVLPKWAVAEDDRAAYALLRWIQEAGAREALPEIPDVPPLDAALDGALGGAMEGLGPQDAVS
jgi:hypothetical protein